MGCLLKSLLKILILLSMALAVGFTFNWFSSRKDVLIGNTKDPVVDKKLESGEKKETDRGNPRPEQGISTEIGRDMDSFIKKYGNPDRKEASYYDYEVYVYSDPTFYMQVGVRDGIVAMISVAGTDVDVTPFQIGEKLEEVYKKFRMQPQVELSYEDGIYHFELFEDDLNIRPLISMGDIFAQLYFDGFTGDLLFVRWMDKRTLLLQRPYDLTYLGPLVEMEELSDEQWKEADEASERQIFELTNLVRSYYQLPELIWDGQTAKVAYHHSVDMYETETFSHVSERFGSLAERLERAGIYYESAGENIAYQYTDSVAVMSGWLNSKGHRETMLNEEFTHLGVGVYRKYFTQNFLKKTWDLK